MKIGSVASMTCIERNRRFSLATSMSETILVIIFHDGTAFMQQGTGV